MGNTQSWLCAKQGTLSYRDNTVMIDLWEKQGTLSYWKHTVMVALLAKQDTLSYGEKKPVMI